MANDIELTVGLDTSDYDKGMVKVESTSNQLARATAKYAREEKALGKLLKDNKISSDLYAKSITDLSSDFNALEKGLIRSNNQFKSFSSVVEKSETAVGGLGRRMNRTGVVVQQTGYQVGDFLVQVQSGTNWMVAFGQQATQVAGTLTMFGGKMLWIGSALGILIPLVTALGAAWMRTRVETEKTETALESLNGVIRSLSSNTKILEQNLLDLQKPYGAGAGAVRDYAEALNELKILQAKLELGKTTSELEESLKFLVDPSSDFGTIYLGLANAAIAAEGLTKGFQKLQSDLGLSYDQAVKLQTELAILSNTPVGEMGDRFKVVSGLIKEMGIDVNKLPPALVEALVTSGELSVKTAELAALMERSKDAVEGSTAQTYNWANAMSSVRSEINAILSGLNSLGGGAILNIAKKSEIAALQAGASLKDASRARQRSEFETQMKIESQGASLVEKGLIALKRRQFEYGLELDKTLDKERELAREREKTAGKTVSKSAGGGGGTSGVGADVFGFAGGILGADDTSTKLASLDVWYEEALLRLATFNERELEVLREHGINKATIEDEYQSRVMAIKNAERTETLNNYGSLFGALGSLMGAEGKKLLKIQAGISAASTMISAYEAAAAAAKAQSNVERFGIWAAFIAKGVSAVAKIKAIGSSGSASGGSSGGGGGGGSGNIATPTGSSQGAQTVIIEGIDANSLITGSQLSEIFDKLYEENEERGLVFQVAT